MLQHLALIFVILACLGGVASRRVHTGVFATVGLLLIICGCLAELDGNADMHHALELRTWGMVAIAHSFVWRFGVRPWLMHLAQLSPIARGMTRFWGIIERRGSAGRRFVDSKVRNQL